jgi:hypothetical protein
LEGAGDFELNADRIGKYQDKSEMPVSKWRVEAARHGLTNDIFCIAAAFGQC